MSDKINFKAFEEGGLDELLRKTVEGHRVEPKPGLWKGISRKLLWHELTSFNFTNLSIKWKLTGVIGLVILAGVFYYILPISKSAVPAANETSTLIPVSNPPVVATGALVTPASSKGSKPGQNNQGVYNSPNRVPENGKTNNNPAQTAIPSSKPIAYANNLPNHPSGLRSSANLVNPEPELPASTTAAVPVTHETLNEALATGISQIDPLEASLLVIPRTDTIITIRNAYGTARFLKTKQDATQFFAANLGVAPEVSFYDEPESYSKMNVWAHGGLTYHISRFSVYAGLGVGNVYNQGSYRVEYKSNDSVGYYTSVVSYTVGSNNEIKYNTVTKSVYDSLNHLDDYRTLNRYTYLQIPVLFGYRLLESGRISLTFRAGPAFSILADSRKSSSVIEYSNARIIRVDDKTPSPLHSNWQLWGDLLLEIRMNKKTSIYFAPSCKYFLSPMVEQENIRYKAPWTVGLGIGVQFNFAPKKKSQ